MLDRERCEVRTADQIARGADRHNQLAEERGVPLGRMDDRCIRLRQPTLHQVKASAGFRGDSNTRRIRAEPHEGEDDRSGQRERLAARQLRVEPASGNGVPRAALSTA
jgi:hypothetical protein